MKRIALFLIGCAVLVGFTLYAGAGAVGRALITLGPGGLAIIALLHLPVLILMGLAWWSTDRTAGTRKGFVAARFVRDAAGEVLPFSQLGGFAIGVRALSLTGVNVLRGAVAMFADLMMEFAAKLPYTACGLLLLATLVPGAELWLPLTLALLVVALALIVVGFFRAFLASTIERFLFAALRNWLRPGDTLPSVAASFTASRLVPCFALQVVCWFIGAAETWVIFTLMHVPVTPAEALVIDSLANALRTFGFFVPAAAGVQEGAYLVVCALFGVSPGEAVAFSLARRAREIVLGIPGLALWQALEARKPSGVVEHREIEL